MKHSGMPATSFVAAALLLSSCASVPSSTLSLAEGSAAACAKVLGSTATSTDRQRCSLFHDLVVLERLLPHIEEALRPDLAVILLPCPADGPGCRWQDAYDRRFSAGLELVFGDPSPQPNAPVPFEAIPAQVQLQRATALREGLAQAVSDLDDQIEALGAAAQQ